MPKYANPRNATSGLVNTKDLGVDLKSYVPSADAAGSAEARVGSDRVPVEVGAHGRYVARPSLRFFAYSLAFDGEDTEPAVAALREAAGAPFLAKASLGTAPTDLPATWQLAHSARLRLLSSVGLSIDDYAQTIWIDGDPGMGIAALQASTHALPDSLDGCEPAALPAPRSETAVPTGAEVPPQLPTEAGAGADANGDPSAAHPLAPIFRTVAAREGARASLPFNIDGVVLKVDSIPLQLLLGYVARDAKWAVAFKFQAASGATTVHSITMEVGRTGRVTPVLLMDGVEIAGSVIQRTSLHNHELLRVGPCVSLCLLDGDFLCALFSLPPLLILPPAPLSFAASIDSQSGSERHGPRREAR